MLHALAAGERRVFFIHACDNGDVHALREEVEGLAASRPGIIAHFCYRFPTGQDQVSNPHHSQGVISRDLLQKLLPLDDYDFYLCGSRVMIHDMTHLLDRSFADAVIYSEAYD